MSTIPKPAAPVPSTNMLEDFRGWCQKGDCVVLYNSHDCEMATYVYHKCQAAKLETSGKNLSAVVDVTQDLNEGNVSIPTDTEFETFVKGLNLINVDFANHPDLLDEEEGYPYYLEQEAKCQRCRCILAKKLREVAHKPFPHVYFYSVPKLPGFC
jgi:hypothetical protein